MFLGSCRQELWGDSMKITAMTLILFFSSLGFAKTENAPWRGPHTLNRVLVPSDSVQATNYLLPIKNSKKPNFYAPLITTEIVFDPERKFKHLKITEQTNLPQPPEKSK